jgi:hypothetical protein
MDMFSKKRKSYKYFCGAIVLILLAARAELRWLTSAMNADKKPNESQILPDLLTGSSQFIHTLCTPMKLKQDQLERLATSILVNYNAKELIIPKAPEADLKTKVMAILSQNFAEEEAIEEEARQMLASYARVSKDMDPYKMFILAKQKLAAKKGFIL